MRYVHVRAGRELRDDEIPLNITSAHSASDSIFEPEYLSIVNRRYGIVRLASKLLHWKMLWKSFVVLW